MVLRRSSRSPRRSGADGTQPRTGKASHGGDDSGTGLDSEAGGADLVHAFVDEITWYMSEHKVSRADLAQSMAVSPGRVSQILSGEDNLTLRTLSAVLDALGPASRSACIPWKIRGSSPPAGADPARSRESPGPPRAVTVFVREHQGWDRCDPMRGPGATLAPTPRLYRPSR